MKMPALETIQCRYLEQDWLYVFTDGFTQTFNYLHQSEVIAPISMGR